MTDDTKFILNERQAYMAMFVFLDHLYDLAKPDDLGDFLSGMRMLEDGKPMDSAYWQDWMEAIKEVLNR